jgi:hypothetical protein
MHKTALEMRAILESRCSLEFVTVDELTQRVAALGYRLDRSLDCRAEARFISGPLGGMTYPCCTTYIVEADTGRSAFHYQARRDTNFCKLQELRGEIATVSRGAILEI